MDSTWAGCDRWPRRARARRRTAARWHREVSLLRAPRGQGGRLAREEGRERDPPPAAMPQPRLPEALHELRAHRRHPVYGRQEGREPRAFRAAEAHRRVAESLREAPGERRGD